MRVTVVTLDDWQTLYVDGEKQAENHSISLRDLERFIPEFRVVALDDATDAAVSYYGETLPDSIDDLAEWSIDLVRRKESADGSDD